VDLSAASHAHPWITAAILGVVEGVTEFIPVSSTGHLIIVGDWLGYDGETAKTFEIFIQLGAILAIVWLYRARLARTVVKAVGGDPLGRRLLLNLLIAFLPAAAVGSVAHDAIKRHLFTPVVVAGALVGGGIVILLIERWRPKPRIPEVDDMPASTALGVGLAQVLSLVPGTSRSGATIMGAYCLGLTRKAATEFSFFLAIPVMVAATCFDLLESRGGGPRGRGALPGADVPVFVIGFAFAFASALVVVRGFISYVARHSFSAFAWYRIGFGLLLLLWYRHHPW
jgi:undecaprenyl-diphosphatase